MKPPISANKTGICRNISSWLAPLSCVCALLFTGCMRTIVPTLTPVYSEEYSDGIYDGPRFLAYSSDGQTLLVGARRRVNLYHAHDHQKRVSLGEDYFETVDIIRSFDRDKYASSHLKGVGYIDENTWYFAYAASHNSTVIAEIHQIEPARMLFQHDVKETSNPDDQVQANRHHLAYLGTLLDWRDGTRYPVETLRWNQDHTNYTLLENSQVMTWDRIHGIMIHDPVRQEHWTWNPQFTYTKTGFLWSLPPSPYQMTLSDDRQYALAVRGGRTPACELWQLPEKQKIGQCGDALAEYLWPGAVFQPGSHLFAVVVKNRVNLHTAQPFQRLHSFKMPAHALTAALDMQHLAAADTRGTLRVWRLDDGALLAEYPGDPDADHPYALLSFQPDGSRLAVVQGGQLRVFDLAELHQSGPASSR